MKIWFFAGDTLLVEYEGRPYKVELNSDEPPYHLCVNPNDDVSMAFSRFLKFAYEPWYHGRVIPKPKTTAKRVMAIFDAWKTASAEIQPDNCQQTFNNIEMKKENQGLRNK